MKLDKGFADTKKTEVPAVASRAGANRRLAWLLALVAAGFLGFGFALVPLYNTFCHLTGFNGATGTAAAALTPVDRTRWVTVEFTGMVMPGLPWKFRPAQRRVRVHPGETAIARYYATNLGDRTFDGRAIMSVSPEVAATHFEKIECFCFHQEALEPGQTREFSVEFFVTPGLPKYVTTMTLSYAFFPSVERGDDRSQPRS